MINAMILAAGRGQRLRPLTDHTPKALLMVGDQTLIEHRIRALVAAGVCRIIINLGHLGDQIRNYLGDGARYGVELIYSPEPVRALETAGGIIHALPLIQSDRFIVINADIWSDYNLNQLINHQPETGHLILVDNPSYHPAGDFILKQGQIFSRANQQENKSLTFSGIGLYHKAMFAGFKPGVRPLGEVFNHWIAKTALSGEHYRGHWFDIGTRDRLNQLNKYLIDQNKKRIACKTRSLQDDDMSRQDDDMSSNKLNQQATQAASDYLRIASAIEYLHDHVRHQPKLDDLAQHLGLSPTHCQRLFKRWCGISPKRFIQAITLQDSKRWLRDQYSLLEVSELAGLSSVSRLHDLFISHQAVTPAQYKHFVHGLEINYAVLPSPLGECLLASTAHGLCGLYFIKDNQQQVINRLKRKWQGAKFVESSDVVLPYHNTIFGIAKTTHRSINLILHGTQFQLQVWQALLALPGLTTTSYSAIADTIHHPMAQRAVGSAVGENPIHYLIPCHRVLRKDGSIGGFATGTIRKQACLIYEHL